MAIAKDVEAVAVSPHHNLSVIFVKTLCRDNVPRVSIVSWCDRCLCCKSTLL